MATNNTTEKFTHLKEMLQNTYSVSLENYHKCLVGLSYELLIENEESLALTFLSEIPSNYFINIMPAQASQDPLFNLCLRALSDFNFRKKINKKIQCF